MEYEKSSKSKRSQKWTISQNMYSIGKNDDDDKWDHSVDIFPDESFLSWFTRLAKVNSSDTILLYQKLMVNKDDRKIENVTVNQHQNIELIDQLKEHVRIPTELLEYYKRKINSTSYWEYLNIPSKKIRYCPLCLTSDKNPYFRKHWQWRGICICIIHKILLLETCQNCFSAVKYWRNKFDEIISICFKCKKLLSDTLIEPQSIPIEIVKSQVKLKDVYNGCQIYSGNELDHNGSGYFRQLWKLIVHETDIDIIKNGNLTSEIPLNQLVIALHQVCKIDNFDERLIFPYRCEICVTSHNKFETFEELQFHNRGHYLENINNYKAAGLFDLNYHQLMEIGDYDAIASFRYEIVKTLLQVGTTKEVVKNMAKTLQISSRTIQRWIALYKKYQNKDCLRPKYSRSGRKPAYSLDALDQFTNSYKEFEGRSLKEFYNTKCQELLELNNNFSQDELPSYQAVRRHVLQRKN